MQALFTENFCWIINLIHLVFICKYRYGNNQLTLAI